MNFCQGKHKVKYRNKYVGDPDNVVYRSSWEKRFMCWCEENNNVISWSSETIVIPYVKPFDKAVHRYFVDFKIVVKDKNNKLQTYLVEIKPYSQSVPPKNSKRKKKQTLLAEQATFLVNQAKWQAARKYCGKRGWKFIVITEKELGLS